VADTGWQPAFDLSRGIAATERWYKEQGWL
jgi:nucleoside-diphosphate-sugar epimerase